MSDNRSKYISRAGFGKTGYCRLCSFSELKELNQKLGAGWNARQIMDWLKTNFDVTVTRQTIYTHRDYHAKHPEDRVVSAVEKAKNDKAVMMPRVSSNEEFLEAIRDLGYRRAVENPEEVTIDHGLKAAQTLAQSKSRGGDTIILLARWMTGGGSAPDVIEGTAVEVTN